MSVRWEEGLGTAYCACALLPSRGAWNTPHGFWWSALNTSC